MKSFLIKSLLAACLVASVSAAVAIEPADEGKMASIIENAKILDKGYKVRVSVSGPECSVSTFRSTESVNTDNDCKITAALIAKELMIGHDFGIRKMRVYFHSPTMTGMLREVPISYAEIQALEGGAVKQEDFLQSLSVNMIAERALSGSTGSGAASSGTASVAGSSTGGTISAAGAGETGIVTTSNAATGNATAITSSAGSPTGSVSKNAPASAGATGSDGLGTSGPAGTAAANTPGTSGAASSKIAAAGIVPQKNPEEKIYTSPKNGMRFAVPAGWVVEDTFPATMLFKLYSPATGERNIELSFNRSTGKTPAECAREQRQKFNYEGVKGERYQQVQFGKGKYPGALIVLTYPNWDAEGKRYYEMHLYFGQNGGIYDLWAWCVFSKYSNVDPAFQKLMATMEFPAAKGAASKTKSSPTKKK